MKRRIDRYINDIFKTPFDLELSPILIISLLNVMMSVGTIVKIEITRRVLQAVFSAEGHTLLYEILFLAVYELIYCITPEFTVLHWLNAYGWRYAVGLLGNYNC